MTLREDISKKKKKERKKKVEGLVSPGLVKILA